MDSSSGSGNSLVVDVLGKRYAQGTFYARAGRCLVALNPYADHALYSRERMQPYLDQAGAELCLKDDTGKWVRRFIR